MNQLREVELIIVYRLLVCFMGSELESHSKTDSGISIVLTYNTDNSITYAFQHTRNQLTSIHESFR